MTTTRRREFYLAEPEKFYELLYGEYESVPWVRARIDGYGELDCALVDGAGGWLVIDGVVGTSFRNPDTLPEGFATQAEAIREAKKELDRRGGIKTYVERRDFWLDRHGLSPRYAFSPEDDE